MIEYRISFFSVKPEAAFSKSGCPVYLHLAHDIELTEEPEANLGELKNALKGGKIDNTVSGCARSSDGIGNR